MKAFVLLIGLLLLSGCSKNVVNSTPDRDVVVIDSLQHEIEMLRFIIGQQRGMIKCLQDGGTDCYGGV